MIRAFFVLILSTSIFIACTPKSEQLPKVWFFITEDILQNHDKASKGKLPEILTSLSFIDFQPNGYYTAYLEDFEFGKWTMVGSDQIALENSNKQTRIVSIKKLTNKELQFTLQNRMYSFEGFENKFTSTAENPYSVENNKWRIKATHKESEKEIRERLKNHFLFWEKYFAWALTTKKEILNVRSLPSPLKIYSNGFEVIPYADQDPRWQSNFYDSTDCKLAYDKLNTLLQKEDIDWPTTDNRFKLFVSAFKQLQRKID